MQQRLQAGAAFVCTGTDGRSCGRAGDSSSSPGWSPGRHSGQLHGVHLTTEQSS